MSPPSPGPADRPALDGAPPADDDARGGLKTLLARVAALLAGAADTRVRLAMIELAEERERARDRLVLGAVLAIAAAFALLALNGLVLVLLWGPLGWGALALLAACWGGVAALAGWRLAAHARRAQRPFAATLAQLDRDRAWLTERLGAGEPPR